MYKKGSNYQNMLIYSSIVYDINILPDNTNEEKYRKYEPELTDGSG